MAENLNWEWAEAWQTLANEGGSSVKWYWDCNFKLDYDGGIVTMHSRFYPPHKNAGDWWEGGCTIQIAEKVLVQKEFKEDTLNQLKEVVEQWTDEQFGKIREALREIYR